MIVVPAVLASPARVASVRAVWACRSVFGAVAPELHVVRRRSFLTAAQAREVTGLSEGLDYDGTFVDALQDRRVCTVLPLLENTDGAVQGLLEFLGVPYAGCGLSGAVLAHDAGHADAVLSSLGLIRADSPSDVLVGVLGNEEPLTGDADGAEEFCRQVYRGLGLSGWALIGAARHRGGWCWTTVEVQPDLAPGSPFLVSLERRGIGLEDVLKRVLGWGQARHDAELSLKSLFKDKI